VEFLLVPSSIAPDGKAVIQLGGLPFAPNIYAVEWPKCMTCSGFMQFLAQVPLSEKEFALVFMCQNQPGLCDEWNPDAGGNTVRVITSGEASVIQAPGVGETTLPFQVDVGVLPFERAYEAALREPVLGKAVLGKLGGTPEWIQTDETPSCSACGSAMSFVGQFEQATNGRAEMNFGGGLAYLFQCSCAGTSAKFLWQC